MRISNGKKTVNISIDERELEQVGRFCNLGSTMTSDAKCYVELKRTAMRKDAFYKKRN